MSKFFSRKVKFPLGRLSPEFVEIYLERYTVPVETGVTLDGIPVSKSTSTSEEELSTIFPDDAPLTRFRKASLFDGTIPIEPVTDSDENLIAQVIHCGWPEKFLNDIANTPEGMEFMFDGVEIIEP